VRARLIASMAALALLAVAPTASAEHAVLDRVSSGPHEQASGSFDDPVVKSISDDGSLVFFTTIQSLVAEDGDDNLCTGSGPTFPLQGCTDIYLHSSGTTKLISAPPGGSSVARDVSFGGASKDGTRIFFSTGEALVPEDADAGDDVYEYSNGTTTLVTPGIDGGNVSGVSADGSHVFFSTDQQLSVQDTDSQTDIYERFAGATTLVSTAPGSGNAAVPAYFADNSDDGNHVYFETTERLLPTDSDNRPDLYERSGGVTKHLTTGPTGGNGDYTPRFGGASADGQVVAFDIQENLTPDDTDSCFGLPCTDVYVRRGGTLELASTGPVGGNGSRFAFIEGPQTVSDDGDVFFSTDEQLTSDDGDTAACSGFGCQDIYKRSGSTTSLISTGPNGGSGAFDATLRGTTDDGSHAYFETRESLVSADSDSQVDVYERSGATTTLVSSGTVGGNGAFAASFRDSSQDGSRVFFMTAESLVPLDQDSNFDVYERHAGTTTLVSPGSSEETGGTVSDDGSRVLFTTSDRLLPNDTDSTRDLYAASLASTAPYPRPGGGTPFRVPLVAAFDRCTAPNSSHVGPLAYPSCSPPTQSSLATNSSNGFGQGVARFDAQLGDPSTPADEADLGISVSASDVRRPDNSDYTDKAMLVAKLRLTDRASGPAANVPATVQDVELSAVMNCVPTLSPVGGAVCAVGTSADALLPGLMQEGRRTIISVSSVEMKDVGPDLDPGAGPICQPACGSGDEGTFLHQGVFAP
jgi:hypothetical protein